MEKANSMRRLDRHPEIMPGNVLPRYGSRDPLYFLNRKVDRIRISGASNAQDAVFQAIAQIPGEKQQIAVLQTGSSLAFPKVWTWQSGDATVFREVLDRIAGQLGPTFGWQLSGAKDFRMLTFYAGLSPGSGERK